MTRHHSIVAKCLWTRWVLVLGSRSYFSIDDLDGLHDVFWYRVSKYTGIQRIFNRLLGSVKHSDDLNIPSPPHPALEEYKHEQISRLVLRRRRNHP